MVRYKNVKTGTVAEYPTPQRHYDNSMRWQRVEDEPAPEPAPEPKEDPAPAPAKRGRKPKASAEKPPELEEN